MAPRLNATTIATEEGTVTESRWIDLNRRVAAMHSLWQRAVADLTVEQVNYVERDGVLPIAFSLVHFVLGEDRNVSTRVLGEPLLWEWGDWAARVGGNVPQVNRGASMDVAASVRFADVDAWRAYQTAVFARTEAALAALPAERWSEVLFEQTPEAIKGSFAGLIAGEGPVRLGDVMDAFVYQHGVRHLGEIEHARSLVGLGGVS